MRIGPAPERLRGMQLHGRGAGREHAARTDGAQQATG